ncbi:hypothetical protein P7K49_005048 [Saguinus oedipus]|uniref:Uncharacterized protein n=1 Tax=Saguinus oedipus TaxID=9490 RepID=A0ABQ9WA04_SAGOE|nr:hypothetical protein P7K49_005048 [Saguinus oedipus]
MSDGKGNSPKSHYGYELQRMKGVWGYHNIRTLQTATTLAGTVWEQDGLISTIDGIEGGKCVTRKSERSNERGHVPSHKTLLHIARRNKARAPHATVSWLQHASEHGQWVVLVVPVCDMALLCLQVNEVTVEQLVQQYPHITFSTVLQDCKRTLERAYQMGWTPNMSAASS